MRVKSKSRVEKTAVAVSSWIINKFTSDNYKKFIRGAVIYGMNSAARDSIEDRPHPPNWWEDRRNLSG